MNHVSCASDGETSVGLCELEPKYSTEAVAAIRIAVFFSSRHRLPKQSRKQEPVVLMFQRLQPLPSERPRQGGDPSTISSLASGGVMMIKYIKMDGAHLQIVNKSTNQINL
jgi:hypothetical protein